MNIIEAIKSGKPYRRPHWGVNWRQTPTGQMQHYGENLIDLLADDWEIQEPTVTITKTQFWDACREAIIADMSRKAIVWEGSQEEFIQRLSQNVLGELARKLGLGN